MDNETTKRVLHYVLTPQILPRVRGLCFSGFSHVAFFMAQIYHAARLLPDGHPYLSANNSGRFGIRHVIAEAGNHLVFKKENADQIVVYVMMLVGWVLLLVQMVLLGFAIFVQAAQAFPGGPAGVPGTFAAYFLVPDATNDLAFVLLDRVFGIPDFFVDVGGGTTCVVAGEPCFDLGQSTRVITPDNTMYSTVEIDINGVVTPGGAVNLGFPWPLHNAMHGMFEAYSVGLLLIAVFILLYFVVAVIAETAQSGTAFGRRFNHVWAPLRIIAAIGMLVPLTNGFNSAQYILLFAAKWGSGFATNGWILFNNTAIAGGNTLLGAPNTLVATPNVPPVNTLLEFFTVAATCQGAYQRMYYEREDRDPVVIDAWLVNPENAGLAPIRLLDTSFDDAVAYFNNNNDILVRFGELRDEEHQTRDGRVAPFCGEVTLHITDVDQVGSPGSYYILSNYYVQLQLLWTESGTCVVTNGVGEASIGCVARGIYDRYLPIGNNPNAPLATSANLEEIRVDYQTFIDGVIAQGVTEQQASPEWLEQLSELGWGGAAIWYNKVAQMNGSLISATYSMPVVKTYPEVMEQIRRKKANADADTPGDPRHMMYQGPDEPPVLGDEEEGPIAKSMFAAQSLWHDHYAEKKKGGNIFLDVINAIFGTSGLFSIQENADLGVHPLAQLASIGRSIIESAIANLGYSAAAGLGGGIINLFGEHLVGKAGMMASGFLFQLATMGLTIGFVLFYIVPFMPFIYFFFAVGGWIKAIFEAMVGVPLWALAHIRIDGNGLPGDAAMGGYWLILEVFLRPIMVLFGFLASIVIFAAQVQILHEIWPLVVSNASGFDMDQSGVVASQNQTGGLRFLRGAIDKFFFTVIYAIVVYMLGMSSFKMIDLVPNHILRWMGASVSTFGDQSGDPAENLVRNSTVGIGMVTGTLRSGGKNVGDAAKHGKDAFDQLATRAGG